MNSMRFCHFQNVKLKKDLAKPDIKDVQAEILKYGNVGP